MIRGSTLAGTITALLCATRANGDNVVLTSTKDNTLYETTAGDSSNGAGSFFFTGSTRQSNNELRRGLVRFDVAGSIPQGAKILSVSLQLHVSKSRGGSHTTDLHRVLADWGEGTSNAPGAEGSGTMPSTGDATWLHTFYPASFWASKGGDFSPTVSATLKVGGSGFYQWGSTADMVNDVQAWLDQPATNFGWIVIGQEGTSQSAKRFDSRENTTVANRPSLSIEYCPPASWITYGSGWPGTLGVPGISSSGNPHLCQSTTVTIGNSLGSVTPAVLFGGFTAASLPTSWGGTLLVQPLIVAPFVLPAGGFGLTFPAPCDNAFCGVHIYLQALELDAGASKGVAFTPGLDLLLGG